MAGEPAGDDQYVEGQSFVRIALIGLLLGAIGLFFVLADQIEQIILQIGWVAETQPQVAVRMGNRLLLWLVLLSGGVSCAIGTYLYFVALRILREERYPPAGLPLAFRARIERGETAIRQGRRYRFLALLLCFQPIAGLAFWYWISGGVV